MKLYWLSPADGRTWLPPQEVVERWTMAFPRVLADAEAARVRGERFIGKYRELLAAGAGHNPTPLDEIERRWSGAGGGGVDRCGGRRPFSHRGLDGLSPGAGFRARRAAAQSARLGC
jgi:hypothetical protein